MLNEIISGQAAKIPEAVNKPLVIYGAGKLGKLAVDFFDHCNLPVECVLDQNVNSEGFFENSIPLFHPDKIAKSKRDQYLVVIAIVNTPITTIINKLRNNGWKHVMPFYDVAQNYTHLNPLNNGWFSGSLNLEEKNNLKNVLMLWNDDQSRAAYLQFLAWRILRQEWTFETATINTLTRFFTNPVLQALTDHEVFVDLGAHDGGVVLRFLEITNYQFSAVFAFEPDIENYKQLEKSLSEVSNIHRGKISIFQTALDEYSRPRFFYNGFGLTSRLGSEGEQLVSTIPLDKMQIPASFIKIHIEGGELDALKGSCLTIKTHRPLLAITVYHNSDGMWKIPLYLSDNFDDYIFFFAVHAWCGTGAVLYGIPKERFKGFL